MRRMSRSRPTPAVFRPGISMAICGLLAFASPLTATGDPFATEQKVSGSRAGDISPCNQSDISDHALTLTEVVEYALCNNPQTRETWANAKAQAAQIGIAESAYLPTLSGSASASRNRAASAGQQTINSQSSAGVTLNYLLYDFGSRDAALESAEETLKALNATQNATLQSVFLAALQAYYQLFAARAATEAADKARTSSQESLNAATTRYRIGAATSADKLQAQTAFAQAALNLLTAEGNEQIARGVLANAMGLEANQPLHISAPVSTPDEHFEADIDKLIDIARKQRPDLIAAESQLKAARASLHGSEAADMPTISLFANQNISRTSNTNPYHSGAVGLSVSLPLFTGYNTTYRILAAEAQLEARTAQRDRIHRQISLDVWRACQNLKTNTATVRASAELLASAEESERLANGRYKAGVGNMVDLLTAQSALASARQQRVQALYNWQIARATLAQAIGQQPEIIRKKP
ncbi:TolC family protein [Mariprofundus erugo]|uniref:Protein CyaE n=2 Tax=Mariprofundus erugo TaxID=2528639 RepID=A0A5R9GW13_9PROT|nr:TolC family protein [Mariprofundus erugo]